MIHLQQKPFGDYRHNIVIIATDAFAAGQP